MVGYYVTESIELGRAILNDDLLRSYLMIGGISKFLIPVDLLEY